MIKGIACIGRNGELGYKGTMPWGDDPLDGRHFRSLTEGHTVVMGRKTWDSMDRVLLPNRKTIVLTKDESLYFTAPRKSSFRIARSVEDVLAMHMLSSEDYFIIGGAEIYELFALHMQELYITMVDADFQSDTFLPKTIFDDLQIGVAGWYDLMHCKYDMVYVRDAQDDIFNIKLDKVSDLLVKTTAYALEFRVYKLLTGVEKREREIRAKSQWNTRNI